MEIDENDLFGEPVNPDEQIIARRATVDEYLEYIDKVEYINGRMITGPGVELFLGIEQFPKAIGALEHELAERRQINQRVSARERQVMTEPKSLTTEE